MVDLHQAGKWLQLLLFLFLKSKESIAVPNLGQLVSLANCQWGFQKGKSTVSALLHVVPTPRKHNRCWCVFLDFKKAFDMVPHMPLMSKLEELNLDHHVLVWINNYLANRHQRVAVNGATSESTCVTSGVPQGSILSPLLFLIYIDDIVKVTLSEGSKLVLYANCIAPSALTRIILHFNMTLT